MNKLPTTICELGKEWKNENLYHGYAKWYNGSLPSVNASWHDIT